MKPLRTLALAPFAPQSIAVTVPWKDIARADMTTRTLAPDAGTPYAATARFFCHTCTADVRVARAADGEIICEHCDGNFVEEIDDEADLASFCRAIARGGGPTDGAVPRVRVGDDGAQSDDVGNSDDDLGSLDMDGEGGEGMAAADAAAALAILSQVRGRTRARVAGGAARGSARADGRARRRAANVHGIVLFALSLFLRSSE